MTRPRTATAVLGAGLLFLYAPIAVLIVYSFNASRLVSVWGGWSLHWYGELFRNPRMLDSAALSLKVAVTAATLALILGALAGIAMARFGRFPGRTLFSGMLAAPLMLPEILTGISLLLLFVAMEQAIGWPAERGFWTIVIAHATFGAAFVAVVVQARVSGLDRALEEAAADLGATPATIFRTVTLPLIAPALAAGWLLAFTLSLDDLVIASFVSGPGATTLPMLVYSSIRLGVSPQINALCTLIVIAAGIAALAAARLMRTKEG
jgi:putrescine transport system permease protein